MSLIGKKSFGSFVKIILDILFYLVMVSLVMSPKVTKIYLDLRLFGTGEYLYSTVLSVTLLSGGVVLYVLYHLRKIFKSINDHNPFCESNVKSLFRMGTASFLLATFFIVKLAILQSLLTYILIFVLIIAGCFSWVLSEVFAEALRVKEENDLTI